MSGVAESLVMSLGKLIGDRVRDQDELTFLLGAMGRKRNLKEADAEWSEKYRRIEARLSDVFHQLDAAHEFVVRLDPTDASDAAIIAGNALGFLYQIKDDCYGEAADLDLKRDFARAVAGLEAITRFLVTETKIDPIAYGLSYYCGTALGERPVAEIRS